MFTETKQNYKNQKQNCLPYFYRLSTDPASVQNEQRERAKRVVYSVVYGVGELHFTLFTTTFQHDILQLDNK